MNILKLLHSFQIFILDILYPRHCIVCKHELKTKEYDICTKCNNDFPYTYYWSWRENPAEKILWGRCHFEFVCPLFFYRKESEYKELIHRIKYSNDTDLAYKLGALLGNKLMETKLLDNIDYIVPVPLHKKKKRKRGYNQSEIIARGISSITKIKVDTTVLKREHFTKTQTKIDVGNKWENVEGAFSITDYLLYRDRHILLIDDVLTTGATSEACWNALIEIKNIKVSLATLAFVRPT